MSHDLTTCFLSISEVLAAMHCCHGALYTLQTIICYLDIHVTRYLGFPVLVPLSALPDCLESPYEAGPWLYCIPKHSQHPLPRCLTLCEHWAANGDVVNSISLHK